MTLTVWLVPWASPRMGATLHGQEFKDVVEVVAQEGVLRVSLADGRQIGFPLQHVLKTEASPPS